MKLIFNTRQRNKGTTAGQPVWTLSKPIHDYNHMKLRKCILPNILYSFDETNNYVIVNLSVGFFPKNKRYTLMSDFIADLNASVPSIVGINSMVYSFKEQEGVLSVTYSSVIEVVIYASPRMGLPENVVLPIGSGTFDYPHNFSLINSQIIYVGVGHDFGTSDVRTSLQYGNILACVPLTGVYGDIIDYQNPDDDWIKLEGTDTISQLSLEFYTNTGTICDFRGESVVVEFSLKK